MQIFYAFVYFWNADNHEFLKEIVFLLGLQKLRPLAEV